MSDVNLAEAPAPETPPLDESALAGDAFAVAAKRQARGVSKQAPGAQTVAGVPRIASVEQYDTLAPDAEYLDPEGVLRRKPWQATDLASYLKIPEGATYTDPQGNVRKKPKYEGVDFTTQTLYDMSINDKERRKALERGYPGKVKENPATGELYIEDEGGVMRKPGSGDGLTRAGAVVTSASAPTAGAVLGTIGGGAAGSAVPGAGTFAGATAGAVGGSVLGQWFNDLILGLTGVYDRTGVEEAANLGKAAAMGVAGAGVGRGIGVVARGLPAAAESGGQFAPQIAAHVLGATPERLAQASEIAAKGYKVPPSAWAMESPYLHTAVETFDPKFRTQNVLKQDAERFLETEGGKVLDNLGVPKEGRESLINPTSAVSSEETGAAMMSKARAEMAAQDQNLAQAAANAKMVAQAEGVLKSANFNSSVNSLREAERRSMEAAQKGIAAGFDDIQRDLTKAMEAAKVGGNSGELWTQVAQKFQAVRNGIVKNASSRYERWDSIYGHLEPPNIDNLANLADQVLRGLPESFQQKYPDIVKRIAKIAEKEVDSDIGVKAGDMSLGAGKEAAEPVTLGQLHNLRSMLRSNVNYYDLTPDQRDGVFKLFSGKVNEILQARGQVGEFRDAAKVLNDIDAYYGKNMKIFKDRTIQSVVSALEAGVPADPQILANTLLKEGRTDLINKARKIVGPNYWSAVKAADVQEMLDSSKSLIPGQIDGRTFARQVLDRDRNNMLDAIHGPEAAKLRTQAQYVAMADGKLDIPANPNDTVVSLIQKASQATAAAKAEASADPMKVLQREMKNIDRDFQRQGSELRKARTKEPLGFLYDPTVGAAEAADKILKSQDLVFAAAAKFGENSAEFTMLRQVYAQRMLQGMLNPAAKLEKATPELQRIMFPGASLEEMQTLAKNMEFLTNTKAFSGQGAGSSIAAQERVLNPWGSISGLGPLAKPLKVIPGFDAAGRYLLTKYYGLLSHMMTRPATLQWVARGLNGSPADREAVKDAINSGAIMGGPIGAGVAEGAYQMAPGISTEPPKRERVMGK